MKIFFILIIASFSAYAKVPPMTCSSVTLDPSRYTEDQLKTYYCEVNFQCTVIALNTESIVWDDVDQRREYSRNNDCNDELKLAAMMMEMAKNPPSLYSKVEPEVNQSERGQTKENLPVIPGSPSGSSRVQRQ